MSCCGNHNHNEHGQRKDGNDPLAKNLTNYKWIGIACVLLPMVLIMILFMTNKSFGESGNIWTLIILFLGIASHLVIMPLIMRKKKDHQL